MSNARIQFSTASEEKWLQVNPVLREGELVIARKANGKRKLVVGKPGGSSYANSEVVWDAEQAETYMNTTKDLSENVNVFVPHIDSSGILTWTNKAGLDNPSPITIKGIKGDPGEKGEPGQRGEQGAQGIQGPRGIQGEQGERGVQGAQGPAGNAATITIGNVTTSAPGTSASVTNRGTSSAAVLDFVLPKGKDGADGGVTVDDTLSSTSTNPVQNNVIYNALLNKVGTDIFSGFTLLGGATKIMWREGIQFIGSINAANYSGTARVAIHDGDGNVITSTYATKTELNSCVKTVNNVTPDENGNVNISVSGGTGGNITVDSALSSTSTNPVQNKVIKAALDTKVNKTDKIYEADLAWGGRNIAGGYSPIDGAMISNLGANRFAFGKAEGITVEYSEDAGETWVEYPLTDTIKVKLFSVGGNCLYAGGEKSRTPSVNDMIRVTIDSDAFGTYTALNKFAIEISTGGNRGCYCTIDASLESSPTAFKVFADKVPIEGWSGYNIINTQSFETYGNQPSSQYGTIRFTFGCTTASTTYKGLAIVKIMGFGGVGWNTPSNMAQNGHLYQYNESQEAKFPASITAPNFIGKVNGYTLETSVPANAKFTDTVYTHPATHPASMITGLSTVATSGSYNDLSDKPTIIKTVNNVAPDSNGNVNISVSGGGGSNITVDAKLSATSTNPVQNKAIYNALLNKVGTDIFSGFTLMGATSTIAWRQGSQPIGSINATNYTGTAAKATQDGAGNVITETYATKADVSGVVKSVNGTKPDTDGNVTIDVSDGGVSTSAPNTWTGKQTFQKMKFGFESYNAPRISGATDNPSESVAVYNVQGNFTLDMSVLAGLLSNGDATLFTAYITANGTYTLSITNAGTLKYAGSAADLAITASGLLLNIFLTKNASGVVTSIAQATKLS